MQNPLTDTLNTCLDIRCEGIRCQNLEKSGFCLALLSLQMLKIQLHSCNGLVNFILQFTISPTCSGKYRLPWKAVIVLCSLSQTDHDDTGPWDAKWSIRKEQDKIPVFLISSLEWEMWQIHMCFSYFGSFSEVTWAGKGLRTQLYNFFLELGWCHFTPSSCICT